MARKRKGIYSKLYNIILSRGLWLHVVDEDTFERIPQDVIEYATDSIFDDVIGSYKEQGIRSDFGIDVFDYAEEYWFDPAEVIHLALACAELGYAREGICQMLDELCIEEQGISAYSI